MNDERTTPPATLLTVSEAAQHAGLSRATVNNWVLHGWLPTVRITGRRYVRPDDLAATQARVLLGDVIPTWRHDRQRVGKRLRVLREAAGCSQQQLATAGGLTHEVISLLETGRRSPRAETVRALATALEVTPEQVVAHDPVGLTTLTVAEAGAQLGVPSERVRIWLKEGTLPGIKIAKQWRVLAVVIAELERSGRLRGRSRRLDPRYRG